MKIKTFFANFVAKTSRRMMRLVGKQGTQLTGAIAMAIDKNYLQNTKKPETMMAVTGTNGKTTTSNMIGDVLTLMGHEPVANRNGSNTIRGIASMLANQVPLFGQGPRYAVIEEDEIWTRHMNPSLDLSTLTVTNLFQDSFDRNANIRFVFDRINEGIPKKTKLILNASDSISAYLGHDSNERVYFTILPLEGERESKDSKIQDMIYCPNCEEEIEWIFNRYHHIGEYCCKNCGFTNPEAKYEVYAVDREGKKLFLRDNGRELVLPLIQPTIENIYNQLAAYATLRENGFDSAAISSAMGKINVVERRLREYRAGKKEVISMASKGLNPVANSRIFYNIGNRAGRKSVIYLSGLDQNDPPGYCPAWVYAADFQYLKDVDRFIIFTKFAGGLQFTAILDGIDAEKVQVVDSLEVVIDWLEPEVEETVYVLHDIEQEGQDQALMVKKMLIDKLGEGR